MTAAVAGSGAGSGDSSGPAAGATPTPLSGRRVRRWTEVRLAAASTRTLGDMLSDIYMGVLAAAMSVAAALHAASTYVPAHDDGAATGGGFAPTGAGRIAAPWPVLLALAALAVGSLLVARRLGPVGLDGPRARWWLPLPVDRVGLIGPAAWRWPAAGGGLGAVLGALAVAALGAHDGSVDAGAVVAGACASGLMVAALAVALVLAQTAPPAAPVSGGRGLLEATLLAAGGLVAAGAVVVLVLAPGAPGAPPAGALWALAGLALVGLVLAVIAARRAIPSIPDAEIARGGGVAGAATGAVTQLDTRSLGALMRAGSRPVVHRRARFGLLTRLPSPLRAAAALVAADLLATWRSPARALRPLLAALALALLAGTAGMPTWLLAVGIGVGGYVAARTGAEGARRARLEDGLDAHLPMGARMHRVCRLATAWLCTLPYSVGVAVLLGGISWFALLALAGIGWAAAALRWAYRKDDEGTGMVAPSAFGPVPVGSIILLLSGPDVAVVASVSVGLALWAGSPLPVLLAVAAGLGAVLVAIVTTPPPAYET